MNITSKLQGIIGVGKGELAFIALLFAGLSIGLIIKFYNSEFSDLQNSSESIHRSLDSLAEAQKTTYIGTDINDYPYPELAKGDSVIKKSGFQKKTKKAIGKININTASKLELMDLPGIGEKTALSIVNIRKTSPFNSPEDIMKIKGIGRKKYEKIKIYIVIN